MTRPNRDEALMETALVWSQRSTCDRLQVGAVVSREGRILVQGYNGAPAGLPHCDHRCTCPEGYPYTLKGDDNEVTTVHSFGCPALPDNCRAVHAEQNAIAFAARHGVRLEGGEVFSTHQPCKSCAMSIINSGIVRVVYAMPYRLIDGLQLLEEAGLKVEKFLDLYPAWSDRIELVA